MISVEWATCRHSGLLVTIISPPPNSQQGHTGRQGTRISSNAVSLRAAVHKNCELCENASSCASSYNASSDEDRLPDPGGTAECAGVSGAVSGHEWIDGSGGDRVRRRDSPCDGPADEHWHPADADRRNRGKRQLWLPNAGSRRVRSPLSGRG